MYYYDFIALEETSEHDDKDVFPKSEHDGQDVTPKIKIATCCLSTQFNHTLHNKSRYLGVAKIRIWKTRAYISVCIRDTALENTALEKISKAVSAIRLWKIRVDVWE